MSSKVTLLLRISRPDGTWTYTKSVTSANNQLRPLFAFVDGRPEHHPEGAYYIRYSVHGRRRCDRIGPNATEAKTALKRQQHLLEGLALGVDGPDLPPPVAVAEVAPHRQCWDDAVRVYMLEIEARRAHRTAASYRQTLDGFALASPVIYLDEITREHVLRFEAWIRRKGNTARTAHNRIAQLGTFLRYWKLPDIVQRRDLPHFTKKIPIAYKLGDLRMLFGAASPLDRLLFQFLLGSGCREQEVMYMTAQDIDFEAHVVHVRAKPEWKWEPKDKEERSIPVPDDLLMKLLAHIRSNPPQQRLLFPSVRNRNKPDGHLLRRLKRTALKAGLNCGHCIAKNGDRCDTKPVCKKWSQHGYRRTFATIHHRNGVSARTLMDWLGHSDLETVLAYLASEDTQSEATRTAVNSSFAAVGL